MALPLSRLEAEALQLPHESRAALADKLVESLAESDDDVYRTWKSEAIRRRDEVRSGLVASLPGDEVACRHGHLTAAPPPTTLTPQS